MNGMKKTRKKKKVVLLIGLNLHQHVLFTTRDSKKDYRRD